LVQQPDERGGQAISGRGRDQGRGKPTIVELESEGWTTPQPEERQAERPEQRRVYGV
jgi:hypothetical protein